MNEKEELKEIIELFLLSIIPIILIWITLIGVTLWFTETISYTVGFWVYGILSSILGLIITGSIISNARK